MIASLLRRIDAAPARRAVERGCCFVRHALVLLNQRLAMWMAMLAMVGFFGIAIALGLHCLRLVMTARQG